jgi:hypothetical protein
MLAGPLFLTWVLMGTVSTVQCQGTLCHPARTSAVVAGPHRMAVFPDQATCELYRSTMAQQYPVVVQPRTRPDVTIRKEITFTCTAREDPL